MSQNTIPDEQEDKPLDPAMENVRRKLMKLQLISGGIMLLMFMAVLAAIVYKVTRPVPGAATPSQSLAVPSDAPIAGVATLPSGFRINQVSLSGGQVLFYGTAATGETRVIVHDIAAGRIVADVTVRTD